MARICSACLFGFAVLLASMCLAQESAPGTFSTGPVQPYGGLILTTPSVSLGNGITPPVVSNQSPVYVSVPQPARAIAISSWAESPAGPPPLAESESTQEKPVRMHASLIYPTGLSLSNVSGAALSLGDAARLLRQEPHPPAKRVYTNEDVAKLTSQDQQTGAQPSQPGGQSAPATVPQQPAPQQQKQQRPHQYTVPIGSAPPPDVVPSEEPAQARNPQAQRPGNPFQPKVRESTPPRGGESMGNPTYPKTASPLPLLGALGGALLGAGLIYRSLRSRGA